MTFNHFKCRHLLFNVWSIEHAHRSVHVIFVIDVIMPPNSQADGNFQHRTHQNLQLPVPTSNAAVWWVCYIKYKVNRLYYASVELTLGALF